MGGARNLKSTSFHSSITQESMVATQKFHKNLEEAWNNLYAGYVQGVATTLVLQKFTRGRAKG